MGLNPFFGVKDMEKEAIVRPIKMSDGSKGVRIIFKTFKIAEVIQESQNAVVILLRKEM